MTNIAMLAAPSDYDIALRLQEMLKEVSRMAHWLACQGDTRLLMAARNLGEVADELRDTADYLRMVANERPAP
jgi:hypothetical protein